MDGHEAWLEKPRVERYRIDAWPAQALSAALGQNETPEEGDPLPPFWHHLYGLDPVPAGETDRDGHRRRGSFLPPIDLPRRMWAGGRLRFQGRIVIGEEVERQSVVRRITEKQGRSGRLVFVLVEHRISGAAGSVIEEHDIVYRVAGQGAVTTPPDAPDEHEWRRAWTPDEVLLFRYSALTFNGHRIHYDKDYVTAIEGYPGLIVHGPLLATFLFELVREHLGSEALASFEFRALRPVFAHERIEARGQREPGGGLALWIAGADGSMAMKARAEMR